MYFIMTFTVVGWLMHTIIQSGCSDRADNAHVHSALALSTDASADAMEAAARGERDAIRPKLFNSGSRGNFARIVLQLSAVALTVLAMNFVMSLRAAPFESELLRSLN